MRYHFEAVVKREVLDTISLSVETEGGFKDALKQAEEALLVYPKPITLEGVRNVYTEDRDNLNTQIVSLERRVPTDG